jgi:hypothetical protein
MTRTICILICCATSAFGLTGCYTLSTVNFGNGTAGDVKVQSSQTGQEIEVAPGRFKKLPHAAGDLIVTTQAEGRLKFPHVEPPSLDAADSNYLAKRKSVSGPGYVTLNVVLETNMQLYALVPGKKAVDEQTKQPAGYPKTGEKLSH